MHFHLESCIDNNMRQCDICGKTEGVDFLAEVLHYEDNDYFPEGYGLHYFCEKHARDFVQLADEWIDQMRSKGIYGP